MKYLHSMYGSIYTRCCVLCVYHFILSLSHTCCLDRSSLNYRRCWLFLLRLRPSQHRSDVFGRCVGTIGIIKTTVNGETFESNNEGNIVLYQDFLKVILRLTSFCLFFPKDLWEGNSHFTPMAPAPGVMPRTKRWVGAWGSIFDNWRAPRASCLDGKTPH